MGAFGGGQAFLDDIILAPLDEYSALAERSPVAAGLVLALLISAGIFALLRAIYKQKFDLALAKIKSDAHRAESETDTANLTQVIKQSKVLFENAAEMVKPQFNTLNDRLLELIGEQKRSNDLGEANMRQRAHEQQQLLTINKQGFNDLGIILNDKIDDMITKVDGMKSEVIKDLGKQIQSMVDDLKTDIKGLPTDTAKALEEKILPALEQHKKDIDAKLQVLLDEIRSQTKPVEPVDPPAEPPPA